MVIYSRLKVKGFKETKMIESVKKVTKKATEFFNSGSAIGNVVMWGCFITSAALSGNMFYNFSNVGYLQKWFLAVAIFLELFKKFSLTKSIEFFKKGKANMIVGVILSAIFIGLTYLSLIASVGFAMVSVQGRTETAVAQNFKQNRLDKEIKELDEQIASWNQAKGMYQIEMSKATNKSQLNNARYYLNDYDKKIAEAIKTRSTKNAELEQIIADNKGVKTVETMDMFTLLASATKKEGASGNTVMLQLLYILAVAIELGIAVPSVMKMFTSSKINIKVDAAEIEEEKEMFRTYIQELTSNKVGYSRLITDLAISEKTGIPLNQCKTFRDKLSKMRFKGRPVITVERGGSKTTFKTDEIIKIMVAKYDVTEVE